MGWIIAGNSITKGGGGWDKSSASLESRLSYTVCRVNIVAVRFEMKQQQQQ